ncbi:MAG: pantoate--beta-alanine ligase [Chitinophagaceae bacterium]|nr:MAG: pantoate--beta-alanine ligase [Chitinophagaceae bacterium]
MLLLSDRTSLKSFITESRAAGKSVGFVPTMGALHQGHVSLMQKARHENDVVVCSIFVNPTQFNNAEDFTHYPKTLEPDLEKCRAAGCDAVFVPDVKTMYPQPSVLTFYFGALEAVMEGAHRPGHFNGVATVVSKLFHLVQPDKVYFGQKDLQQFAIIQQLVKDLSFDIELVCCPILRENDGLAMSSRNVRLHEKEREIAPQIYQALVKGKEILPAGTIKEAIAAIQNHLAKYPDIKTEYIEIADAVTLQPVARVSDARSLAICIAVHLGPVRLIDNIVMEVG